jgi:predicted ester cyclase
MSEAVAGDDNKAIVRRVLEAMVSGDLSLLDDHPGMWQSKLYFRAAFAGFPDLRIDIAKQLAEGDSVATRATLSGTHRGEFMRIPATGKTVSFDIFSIDQLADGAIVEHNATADLIGLFGQLGAIPERPSRPE